jgi:predicted MFS family arabinose efflux permease
MGGPRAERAGLAAFLVGLSAAWGAGNIGPVVRPLSAEFDVSLAAVGVLSGTVYFGGLVVAAVFATALAERIGIVWALRVICILCTVGYLSFALGLSFAVLVVARLIAGIGTGFAMVIAPVFAREHGGVRLVGVVGASIQLGVAGALIVGSLLEDAGVDWRVGFVVSAGVALSPLPFLRGVRGESTPRHPRHLIEAEIRDPDLWRLALLFISTLTVPMVVGAWLVAFLVGSGMAAAIAGALSFVMFGSSAAMRVMGGRLSAGAGSASILAGTLLLAAAGLALLALDQRTAVVLVAVLLMGAGFALPYATMQVEAQWLFPPEPVAPMSFLTLIANAMPIAVIPLIGSALEGGHGERAFPGGVRGRGRRAEPASSHPADPGRVTAIIRLAGPRPTVFSVGLARGSPRPRRPSETRGPVPIPVG